MSVPVGSPQNAPDYAFHKSVAAAESGPFTNRNKGINMSNYRHAHIQVIPANGANPTIQVLWWSESAGKFVQEHTAISKTGVGADTPFEFTVDCHGRIMYVAVTTLSAGDVKIYVAGADLYRPT